MIRKLFKLFLWFLGCVVVVAIYSHITNPFLIGNIFHFPYQSFFDRSAVACPATSTQTWGTSIKWCGKGTQQYREKFVFLKESEIYGSNSWLARALATITSGFRIVAYNFYPENLAGCDRIDKIRQSIYSERFDPNTNPHLVTGGHFMVMYPRNFAIFYHDLLNPAVFPNEGEGQNRFRIYAQTVSFARDAFASCGDISTTVVPIARATVACLNIYNYPSDTLYGMFFVYHQLRDYMRAHPDIDFSDFNSDFDAHKSELQSLLDTYIRTVYDEESGLVKKNIALSSTRDGIIRSSSFYDNVILWKTIQYAHELGLNTSINIDTLKTTILTNFWDEKDGYFYDDLTVPVTLADPTDRYSSDWLIAVMTDFLSLDVPRERTMIQRIIDLMIQIKIDEPMPLRYTRMEQPRNNIALVGFFAKDYMGAGIWSLWGMEYLKVLYRLGAMDHRADYVTRADRFLDMYEARIKQYCGFPEVYDPDGKLMDTLLYRSVIRTGWIVGYDAVVALRKSLFGK